MEIPKKTRKDFINAAKVGDIVAFTVAINENNIAWVRVEGHGWPEGIFTALKFNQAKN